MSSFSLSVSTSSSEGNPVKRIIRDNRPGLFDGMVFYVHEYKRDYRGEGYREKQAVCDIIINGGDIVSSPTDPTVTHILVPPDKESKNRDFNENSIINININTTPFRTLTRYKDYIYWNTSNQDQMQDQSENENEKQKQKQEFRLKMLGCVNSTKDGWDVPNLVLFFSENINSNYNPNAEGCQEDMIFQKVIKPVLRFSWIGKCMKEGEILNEDYDWAGQILRGRILPENCHASLHKIRSIAIQAIEMSGKNLSREHRNFAKSIATGSSTSLPPGFQFRSAPTGTADWALPPSWNAYNPPSHFTSNNQIPSPVLSRPNRWSNLNKSLTLRSRSAVPDEPTPEVIVIEDLPQTVNIPMTPVSNRDSVEIEPIMTQHAIALDPRKKVYPTATITHETGTNVPMIQRLSHTPPAIPSPSPSPPSQSNVSADSTSSRGSSSNFNRANQSSVEPGKLFVTGGKPMTFFVHGDNFATEFCIKSGGGLIFPIDYAHYIIINRQYHKAQLTTEEQSCVDKLNLQAFQTVLSSKWVEESMKDGSLADEDSYKISHEVRIDDDTSQAEHGDNRQIDHNGLQIEDTVRDDDVDDDDSVVFVSDYTPVLALLPVSLAQSSLPSPKPSVTSISDTREPNGRKRKMNSHTVTSSNVHARRVCSDPTSDFSRSNELSAQSSTTPATNQLNIRSKSEQRANAIKKAKEVDDLLALLVSELRLWDPKNCTRAKFLRTLRHKHTQRDWAKFFTRHESKLRRKFRDLGLKFPGSDDHMEVDVEDESDDDDDDDLDFLVSDDDNDTDSEYQE
ncbi:uncharacterized protein IL334_006931 [Kwoniella shivajii]|uniref:BRCT domain-containing protein n=1 Tax=Kwoniella shivajii TaxID=564305 RepID=A0ABZ1D7B1_9TREE|nr:hypothetical protein IL334_006931 [Kwoniella shivajii]